MKKLLVALLVGAMTLAMAACGAPTEAPADDAQPAVSAEAEAPADDTTATDDAAVTEDQVYTFEEQAMGGAFVVNWTLTLKADGTFTLLEANPIMGDTTYTGSEWSITDGVAKTGPLTGGEPLAGFFAEDYSCEWTLNDDGTMVAVGYDPDAEVVIDGDGEGAPME